MSLSSELSYRQLIPSLARARSESFFLYIDKRNTHAPLSHGSAVQALPGRSMHSSPVICSPYD